MNEPRNFAEARRHELFYALSRDAQNLFLRLYTQPDLENYGAFRGNLPGLAAEYGMSLGRCRRAFAELAEAGLAMSVGSFIFLPWHIWLVPSLNPNVLANMGARLTGLPDKKLRDLIFRHIYLFAARRGPAWLEPFRESFARFSRRRERLYPELLRAPDAGQGELAGQGVGKGELAGQARDIGQEIVQAPEYVAPEYVAENFAPEDYVPEDYVPAAGQAATVQAGRQLSVQAPIAQDPIAQEQTDQLPIVQAAIVQDMSEIALTDQIIAVARAEQTDGQAAGGLDTAWQDAGGQVDCGQGNPRHFSGKKRKYGGSPEGRMKHVCRLAATRKNEGKDRHDKAARNLAQVGSLACGEAGSDLLAQVLSWSFAGRRGFFVQLEESGQDGSRADGDRQLQARREAGGRAESGQTGWRGRLKHFAERRGFSLEAGGPQEPEIVEHTDACVIRYELRDASYEVTDNFCRRLQASIDAICGFSFSLYRELFRIAVWLAGKAPGSRPRANNMAKFIRRWIGEEIDRESRWLGLGGVCVEYLEKEKEDESVRSVAENRCLPAGAAL